MTATVSLPTAEPSASGFTPNNFTAQLNYTPAAAPTASPTPTSSSTASAVHPVKGYDGKCVDDNGNSSANRAKIQIWGCNGSDKAENWTFSNGEFSHNGKCLNDQGNGGSRSHVILYSCNGGSNEKWSHLANGELKLKAHDGTLCLDDPALLDHERHPADRLHLPGQRQPEVVAALAVSPAAGAPPSSR